MQESSSFHIYYIYVQSVIVYENTSNTIKYCHRKNTIEISPLLAWLAIKVNNLLERVKNIDISAA